MISMTKLINRQYIPGYGDLRVISNLGEARTIKNLGHDVKVYDSIGKVMFLYMGEYVLIPYDVLGR